MATDAELREEYIRLINTPSNRKYAAEWRKRQKLGCMCGPICGCGAGFSNERKIGGVWVNKYDVTGRRDRKP